MKEPEYVRSNSILSARGLTVDHTASAVTLQAADTVLEIEALGVLGSVLDVAVPWRACSGQSAAYHSTVLRALAAYLHANPACNTTKLSLCLRKKANEPKEILSQLKGCIGSKLDINQAAEVVFGKLAGKSRRSS